MNIRIACLAALIMAIVCDRATRAEPLELQLRYQQPVAEGSTRFHQRTRPEAWQPEATAVIVCDMWNSHHCVNAVRRVVQLAPRIDRFCQQLRRQGVTIIHAPSSCMSFYDDHPARQRALQTPAAASFPPQIGQWCDQIPSEEAADYPLDQSDGGEDDSPVEHRLWAEQLAAQGLEPGRPWSRQIDVIGIDEKRDYISDNGQEIWSILQQRNIANVILVGVHTNMCVLGRPFGLRRLAAGGKNVVLARDLTDTMYNPRAWPYASHFTGTDLIVQHIERHVCPTITSNQVLGGAAFRFAGDRRLRLTMLIAEDEYRTEETLPEFAARHLSQHFRVEVCFGSEQQRHQIVGVERVRAADALLISVRRRALPKQDLELIQEFVRQGKPVIGIRTASHAFALRDSASIPSGHAVWPTFDAEVFGGNYHGHFGNDQRYTLALATEDAGSLASLQTANIQPGGSLYRTTPLQAGSCSLLEGRLPGAEPESVAWQFIRSDGGKSFYTSLGHERDFQQPEFAALLAAGIHWACNLPVPTLEQVTLQAERYQAGQGRQR